MGADQTPDPTAWSDDQLDSLLDALAQRANERERDLPGTGASRRGVLAGLLGLGGAATGAGIASAIGESESYGSASGVVGSDSEPLNEANVQDLHAQDAQIDNLEAKQLSPGSLSSDNTDPTQFYRAVGSQGTILSEEWSETVVADGTRVDLNTETDAGLFLIHGQDNTGNEFGNEFFDVVSAQTEGGVGVNTISKTPTTTPPADRVYSIDTGDLTVSISDGGTTYALTVHVMGFVA